MIIAFHARMPLIGRLEKSHFELAPCTEHVLLKLLFLINILREAELIIKTKSKMEAILDSKVCTYILGAFVVRLFPDFKFREYYKIMRNKILEKEIVITNCHIGKMQLLF